MSAINYTSRFQKAVFCEEDIRNSAARAMLFVNFEHRAGGEPVFRSTKVNVRKNLRAKRFLAARRKQETLRRLRCALFHGARKGAHRKLVPLKRRLELAARRGIKVAARNSISDRVVWGR